MRQRKFRHRSNLALCLVASSAMVPVTMAQNAPPRENANEVKTLPPVVVTATREMRSILDQPNSVALLDARNLLETQARTLPEALLDTPGILVQRTGPAQGSPFVRGFTGYRNLALIDGIRLNNSVFRDGPNQYWGTIDPYGLSGIELVKGQGSVLYGSDAIGGTLNALTLRPTYQSDTSKTGTFVGGRAATRWSSAENSFMGRLETTYSEKDRFGVIIGGSMKSFGDMEAAGLGKLPNTGYEEWSADAKFEAMLSPTSRLTLYHQQLHQDDAPRTHATVDAVSWSGTTIGTDKKRDFDQDRWLTYAQLEGTTNGWADTYLLSLSHHRQGEVEERIRGDGRRNLSEVVVDTYGATVQLGSQTPIGYLTYGVNWYHDVVDSSRTDFNADGSFRANALQGPVGDDATYDLGSIFLQDRIDATDRLQIWLGGRVDYARADIGRMLDPETEKAKSYEDDWVNLSGSGRAVFHLDEARRWSLFGGVSTGFRAPNLSDLSRLDGARSDEIETPSPGLDAEQFLLTEIGLRHQGESAEASLVYFHTRMDGQVIGIRTGRVVDGLNEITKVNASDGYIQGIEAEGRWEFTPGWKLFGWVAWQDGETEAPNGVGGPVVTEPVSRLLPLSGEIGLRHESRDGRWWAEILARGATEADRLTTRDQADTQRIPPGGTPGYCIGILRGGVEVAPGFNVIAALENFTDEDYRVHGSGINSTGRGVTISAEWRF
jgi:hemoglobin/transferrin/lactoferrin receptor protein